MLGDRNSSRPGAAEPARLPWEAAEPARVVHRATGVAGGELLLRRAGDAWEIISNGVFLMDTRDGRSERAMVRASLDALGGAAAGARVLIGGLGVGFSAREALDDDRVAEIRVVELEPQVVAWHAGPLGEAAGRVLDDPRCTVVRADLVRWLAATDETFDAVCLDIDNGPDWTVTEGNAALYGPEGLDLLEPRVRAGGVLAFWSAMAAPGFAALLERRYGRVDTVEVAVPRGEPDVVYLARPS